MYNVSALMNTTDYGEYLTILNTESNYVLGIGLLVTVMIILIITFYKEGFATAAAASGFVSTIVGIILFALGILAPEFVILPLLLAAGGFIGLMMNR